MIPWFGELLLRLTAQGRERLMQRDRFDVNVGGAEANGAVESADLGHAAACASAVPDSVLGRSAVSSMRAQGDASLFRQADIDAFLDGGTRCASLRGHGKPSAGSVRNYENFRSMHEMAGASR